MINKYRKIIDTKISRRDLLQEQIADKRLLIAEKETHSEYLTKARWILSEASRITQQRFSGYLESLVTKALTSVFDRPFKFIVDFVMKRNKSECYFYVQDGDKEPEVPKDEMGGGCVDLVSIALRTVLWSLENPRSRNVLILDEPMKFVGKGVLLSRAGKMLKEISHKLGFQLIMVTHETEDLCKIADRVWNVTHNGVHSEVECINIEDKNDFIKQGVCE